MERYIDRLKQLSPQEMPEMQQVRESAEKVEAVNPCVVCSVTLGKELHAGHLFLLSIGDQMQNALNSKLPVALINNNTGPRAAGALVTVAQKQNISLEEGAVLMSSGEIDPSIIVTSYRARSEDEQLVTNAMELLSTGEYDIFASISQETDTILRVSGFNTQIISESTLLQITINETKNINPAWEGTGFIPFNEDRRIVVLQKAGNLTATGTLFTSLLSLSRQLQPDLVVTVDSMPDSADATFVYTALPTSGTGTQISGAGVGFGGEVASGTRGEAFTIKEILNKFSSVRPDGNLRQAALYLTLTRPLSLPIDSSDIGDSFYDFKDNDSLVDLLIRSNDEAVDYRLKVNAELETLREKLSSVSSASSNNASKLIEFSSQKSQALLKSDASRVLGASKKVNLITDSNQIDMYVSELGYDAEDNPYIRGERRLAVRKNYYFSYLNSLLNSAQDIDSIKPEEFSTIREMVQFCLGRVGI